MIVKLEIHFDENILLALIENQEQEQSAIILQDAIESLKSRISLQITNQAFELIAKKCHELNIPLTKPQE